MPDLKRNGILWKDPGDQTCLAGKAGYPVSVNCYPLIVICYSILYIWDLRRKPQDFRGALALN